MDPKVQEIISYFEGLDTTLARRAVYHQILDRLRPHEWRDVRNRINERTFQRDIFGSLPLEMALQIAQYLNLEEIHLSRRTSKRWYDVLSSDPVCSVVFHQYTGRTIKFALGEGKHELTRYAKRRVRLQRGQPVCKIEAHVPFMTSGELGTLDYANGRYAWVWDFQSAILVYSLRSPETKQFCTENRDSFLSIRLSESIVAGLSPRGYCHAWDLQTEDLHSVRLPNLNVRLFSARGTKFVLSYPGGLTSRDEFILHYDLKTRATHMITIGSNLVYIGLPSTGNYIMAVYLKLNNEWDKDPETMSMTANPPRQPHLCIVKYTLNAAGGASQTLSYTMSLPTLTEPGSDPFMIDYEAMHSFKNLLGILISQNRRSTRVHCVVAVSYDPLTDDICLHTLRPENSILEPLCMTSMDRSLLYYLKNDNGKPRIWISDPYSEIPYRAASNIDLELPREAANEVFTNSYLFSLRGDREFVFVTAENGEKVWCFDEIEHQDTSGA